MPDGCGPESLSHPRREAITKTRSTESSIMNTTFADSVALVPGAAAAPAPAPAPAPAVAVAAAGASAPVAAVPAAARPDLYAPIHKALRSAMAETLVLVGRLDVFDAEETGATLAAVEGLLDLCTAHLQHENQFVHAAIEARMPGGAARTADDHIEHLESIEALRAEARALAAAPMADRMGLALRLYRRLALFVAENFQHMHIEESVNNAALWAHYSDAELMNLHDRLVASIAPREFLGVARWMVPALSPVERAGMLNGAKAGMPPEAFLGVVGHVRPFIDAGGWNKLAPAIGVALEPGRLAA